MHLLSRPYFRPDLENVRRIRIHVILGSLTQIPKRTSALSPLSQCKLFIGWFPLGRQRCRRGVSSRSLEINFVMGSGRRRTHLPWLPGTDTDFVSLLSFWLRSRLRAQSYLFTLSNVLCTRVAKVLQLLFNLLELAIHV